jgi:hypothetical protein
VCATSGRHAYPLKPLNDNKEAAEGAAAVSAVHEE